MTSGAYIDLHMHSTWSDGVLAPAALVAMAKEKGLAAISLTDHDAVDGYDELAAIAAEAGIEVLSGVELSCEHNGRDCHILGYGMDTSHEELRRMLQRFRDTRESRGIGIVEKLAELNVHLDMDAILASAGDGALGRPHIANALLEKGYVSSIGEAFARYIGENGPAYVDKHKMTPAEAIGLIHRAGGLAFFAHPGHYLEEMGDFEELLACGADGIEVLHPHHRPPTIDRLMVIASARRMLVSGGSDFHGFEGRTNMGQPQVPYEYLDQIRERLPRSGV